MAKNDEPKERILYLSLPDGTKIARDCHDIDQLDVTAQFKLCPMCGGKRAYEGGVGFLEHDESYNSEQIH